MTADPEFAEADPELRTLVNAVIAKPVFPETLLRLVRRLTGLAETGPRT